MKYIIALLVALSMSVASYADVVRNGDTFKVESTTSADTKTKYIFEDKEGNKYPIYISKRGACYIIWTAKSGKKYKKYLPKDVQKQIKQEIQSL